MRFALDCFRAAPLRAWGFTTPGNRDAPDLRPLSRWLTRTAKVAWRPVSDIRTFPFVAGQLPLDQPLSPIRNHT